MDELFRALGVAFVVFLAIQVFHRPEKRRRRYKKGHSPSPANFPAPDSPCDTDTPWQDR